MKQILFYLLAICLLSACRNKPIANPADYNIFLSDNQRIAKQLEKEKTEMDFWQKRLRADTGSYVDMLQLASCYINQFRLTGQVEDLHIADSFFARCLDKVKNTEPEIYFSVAQNAITQHRFADSWKSLLLADSIGVNPYVIKLLKFDAAMEIGLYEQAAHNLEQVKNENNFDYLLRKAKFEDHFGYQQKAISLMEKALMLAENSGKKSLILWAKSNLADMYGHAGKIKDAYRNYLETLSMDSAYLYALKGIAKIAFSYDKNTNEAKRIIHYILSQTRMPDLYLMLADIAEWEKNKDMEEQNISKFLSEAEYPAYGNMYHKYLISVYAEKLKDFDKAKTLAETEVHNRPTPETYNWLAWVHYLKGDRVKAKEIIEQYVIGKSFEPDALLHAAYIFNDCGKKEQAQQLFKECEASSFELGPLATREMRKKTITGRPFF